MHTWLGPSALDRQPELRLQFAGRVRAQAATGSAYEGGSHAKRVLKWRAPTASPNAAIIPNLATLRDRSRSQIRNDGYAKGDINKLVTNLIGTGITPLSQAPDPAFRKRVQVLWTRWTDESDADGLLDFYGQQAQAVRGWLEGGEEFVRLRPRLLSDGLSVPLQLQVIEPELCPHTHTVGLPTGWIRAGIEFNSIGKRVAYWFYPSRPNALLDFDTSELRRVPADAVVHLFDPLRAGQLRGLPHLTQALIKLHDLDVFDDATLIRQQLSNLFVAFLTKQNASDDQIHPLTGLAAPEGEGDDPPMLGLQPGIFQELDPGEDVTFSEPPDIMQGYADFMRQQLLAVSAATDVPYEVLTGDMKGMNDRLIRVVLQEFRRKLTAWQHQIIAFQLCRPVWREWLDMAVLSGALPMPPSYVERREEWLAVEWKPQGWPYIHPVQDVQAKQEEIRSGITSRSAVVSERGDDAEVIDAQQAADNKRADALGIKYDSDGRQPKNGTAAKPPAPGDTAGETQ